MELTCSGMHCSLHWYLQVSAGLPIGKTVFCAAAPSLWHPLWQPLQWHKGSQGWAMSLDWAAQMPRDTPSRKRPELPATAPFLFVLFSKDHSACFSDCTLSYSQDNQSLIYDFSNLSRAGAFMNGPSFTARGTKFFHFFNISLCGNPVGVSREQAGFSLIQSPPLRGCWPLTALRPSQKHSRATVHV